MAPSLRRAFLALTNMSPHKVRMRASRELKTGAVVVFPFLVRSGIPKLERLQKIATRLAGEDFARAAAVLQQHRQSTISFDLKTSQVCFLGPGDCEGAEVFGGTLSLDASVTGDVDENRAYQRAFLEQAVLATAQDPEKGLQYISRTLAEMERATPLGVGGLAIMWTPLCAAQRMVNLLCALSNSARTQTEIWLNPQFQHVLQHVFTLNRLLDYLREDDLGYNHLAIQMFAQSIFAKADGNETLLARRGSEFADCMIGQVGRDGMQFERSLTYQAHLLSDLEVFLAARVLGDASGEMENLAQSMTRALAAMTHPDGNFALFNDCSIGDGPSPQALGAWPHIFDQGVHRLADCGFVRIEGGSFCTFMDVSPGLGKTADGHAHASQLSLELSYEGKRFIVDPGVASYKEGALRNWTRSARSHNAPRFEGLEPIEFIGTFRIGRRGESFELKMHKEFAPLQCAAFHTGYDTFGSRVARWVGVWPSQGLVCVDIFTGLDKHEAASSLLIGQDWICRSGDLTFVDQAEKGLQIRSILGRAACTADAPNYPVGPRVRKAGNLVQITPEFRGGIRVSCFGIDVLGRDPIPFGTADAQAVAADMLAGLKTSGSRAAPPAR